MKRLKAIDVVTIVAATALLMLAAAPVGAAEAERIKRDLEPGVPSSYIDAGLRAKVPWLAGVAGRVEVDLAVSGLKPDWPPRTATAGIAPAGAVRRIVPLQHESG